MSYLKAWCHITAKIRHSKSTLLCCSLSFYTPPNTPRSFHGLYIERCTLQRRPGRKTIPGRYWDKSFQIELSYLTTKLCVSESPMQVIASTIEEFYYAVVKWSNIGDLKRKYVYSHSLKWGYLPQISCRRLVGGMVWQVFKIISGHFLKSCLR